METSIGLYMAKGFYTLCIIAGVSVALFALAGIVLGAMFIYCVREDMKNDNTYKRAG